MGTDWWWHQIARRLSVPELLCRFWAGGGREAVGVSGSVAGVIPFVEKAGSSLLMLLWQHLQQLSPVWTILLLEMELLEASGPFLSQGGGAVAVWLSFSAVCGTWRTLPPSQWTSNIPEAARGSSVTPYPLAGEERCPSWSLRASPVGWPWASATVPLPHFLTWKMWGTVPTSRSLRGPSESAQQRARSSGPHMAVVVVVFHCETFSVKLRRMLPFPPEIPAVGKH